jgi:two-component system, NtrC family, sensor kinase
MDPERALTLYRLGKLVRASLDLDSTLAAIVDAVHELVEADSTALLLLEDDQLLTIRHGRGWVASAIGERVAVGAGVVGRALSEGRSILIDDMLSEPGRARPDLDKRSGIRSYLAVPLIWAGETLGLVTVGRSVAGALTARDTQLVDELAEQAAAAIAHARAYQQEQARRVELESAYKALELAQQQLAQGEKLTAIGSLAHGIAHELNTPLGVVLANLFVLSEYGQSLSKVALAARIASESLTAGEAPLAVAQILGEAVVAADLDYTLDDLPSLLTESTASATRMAAIVRSVATFAQGSTGPSAPVNVEEALEAAIMLAWNDLKQRAEVVRDYAELPAVMGQSSDLTELFVHLLLNAAYFTEVRGSTITVRTSTASGQVMVAIVDRGRGMTAEQQARVFEPFYTTKPVAEASGLGLSVCHGIVTRYGGTIELKSEGAGLGTTVIVRLPIA